MNRRLYFKSKKLHKLYKKKEFNEVIGGVMLAAIAKEPFAYLLNRGGDSSKQYSNVYRAMLVKRCLKTGYGRSVITKLGYSRHYLKYLLENGLAVGWQRKYR